MARPTHRLDLLLVPALDVPIGRGEAWLSELVQRGVVDADGRPGPEASWLGVGRFARLHLDRPVAPTLYANRLGGFQVRCPVTGAPVISAFSAAMKAWRAGGPRRVDCPSCGGAHPLDDLDYRPPAAVGPWAVVAAEVDQPSWSEAASRGATEALGPTRTVMRRT